MEVSKVARIVHDETVRLVLENPVRPCYGLHQCVVAHWLVEVNCRDGLGVKTCHLHCANEDDAERNVRILEFLIQLFINDSPSMGGDIQAAFLELFNLVL